MIASVLMLRKCCRCGENFGSAGLGLARVCPACRNQLPPQEQQIALLVAQAKSNKQIAYELCLTEGTVKEYLHHIFRKLNISNRTELALWQTKRAQEQPDHAGEEEAPAEA